MAQPQSTRQQPPRSERDALERLGRLEGTWRAEGRVFENPYGGESAWRSVEHYEWLPGRHFLLNRWDADLGGKAFQGLQVIGRDPGTDALVSTFYDNAGNAETYRITASGDTWTFEGREQRATYVIAADASSMEVRWEWKDGAAWRPLCETRARRFEPAPAPRPN